MKGISPPQPLKAFPIASLLLTLQTLSCHRPTPAIAPAAVDQRSVPPAEVAKHVDEMLRAEWARSGLGPASRAEDTEYLRRLYVDIVGTIPPTEVVSAFVADTSPDKRSKAVDTLLASPHYADYWASYWDRILMGREVRGNLVDRNAFHQFLHTQMEKNAGWNHIAHTLLSATGQNTPLPSASAAGSSSAPTPAARPSAPLPSMAVPNLAVASSQTGPDSNRINGAVNWLLKFDQSPQDLAGTASRVFLGVQIQCAQCHDHKTEHWKQDDFKRFTACFARVGAMPLDDGKAPGVRHVFVADIRKPPALGKAAPENNPYLGYAPTALDGASFASEPLPRFALANWVTSPQNPWFAQALVNRLWAHFLGRGFVEPVDDFRASNPITTPQILQSIAEGFTAHGYDIKHLIRTIVATEAYQLSSLPTSTAAASRPSTDLLWSRFAATPMGPEEVVNSVLAASGLETLLLRVPGSNPEQVKTQVVRQFTFLFNVDETFEQERFNGTVSQALMLLNGNLSHMASTAIPGGALADIIAMPTSDEYKIEALYLRTLSRRPRAPEMANWKAFLHSPRKVVQNEGPRSSGPDPLRGLINRLTPPKPTAEQQAYEDLFWALLNSSEFLFNH